MLELTAGGICPDCVVGNEANDTFGGASEGLCTTEVDVASPVVVVVELDVNATLANGFGWEDCDGGLSLSSIPPAELNANNEGLTVVVLAGLTRVVNANGFDAAAGAGAYEDDDGVIFLAPALILLKRKNNEEFPH